MMDWKSVRKASKLIQSIEHSAAILDIIAQQGECARLRQSVSISGIGKTTMHNILQTLGHLGYPNGGAYTLENTNGGMTSFGGGRCSG